MPHGVCFLVRDVQQLLTAIDLDMHVLAADADVGCRPLACCCGHHQSIGIACIRLSDGVPAKSFLQAVACINYGLPPM